MMSGIGEYCLTMWLSVVLEDCLGRPMDTEGCFEDLKAVAVLA